MLFWLHISLIERVLVVRVYYGMPRRKNVVK